MKRAFLLSLFVMLLPPLVFADDTCPSPASDDRGSKRILAKEWFVKGETASKAGDNILAIKAFQCSLSLIPHGFTAFNLAQVAERLGDLEMAITSYQKYLSLMPQADDVVEIRVKVADLKARLAQVQASVRVDVDSVQKHDTPPVDPGPVVFAPKKKSVAPAQVDLERSGTADSSSSHFGAAAWITMGAGVAMVGTGVVLNILARKKMDTSDTRYLDGDQLGAESAHNTARSFAYVSYSLFAAGAVATAVGVTLGLLPKTGNEVSVGPVAGGGLAMTLGGRF